MPENDTNKRGHEPGGGLRNLHERWHPKEGAAELRLKRPALNC